MTTFHCSLALPGVVPAAGGLPVNGGDMDRHATQPTAEPGTAFEPTLHELRTAVKKGELFLRYQPKLDLQTGCISGVEALARWLHPRYGVLEPDSFIPLAEQSGMICEIGVWAINEACGQAHDWQQRCEFSGTVAVNISALELWQPHFVDVVGEALKRHAVDPARLVLEITESCAMGDPALILPTLRSLLDMGVRVSLDDFGTGHASLAHLKYLPISELKVDRTFVNGIEHCSRDIAIVSAILAMANSMGMGVVAEGVETAGQLARLASMGCCVVQGYLVGRPMEPDELVLAVSERNSVWLS